MATRLGRASGRAGRQPRRQPARPTRPLAIPRADTRARPSDHCADASRTRWLRRRFVMGFMLANCWLVPFAFFITLSVNESVLPSQQALGAQQSLSDVSATLRTHTHARACEHGGQRAARLLPHRSRPADWRWHRRARACVCSLRRQTRTTTPCPHRKPPSPSRAASLRAAQPSVRRGKAHAGILSAFSFLQAKKEELMPGLTKRV